MQGSCLITYWLFTTDEIYLGQTSSPVCIIDGCKINYKGRRYLVVDSELRASSGHALLNEGHLIISRIDDGPKLDVSPEANDGDRVDYAALPIRAATREFQRRYIAAQVSRFSGNVTRMALHMGMERSALHRKMSALGLTLSAAA